MPRLPCSTHDKIVDPPESLHASRRELLAVLIVGDVALNEDPLGAGGFHLREGLLGAVDRLGVVDDDVHAFFGQSNGNSLALVVELG